MSFDRDTLALEVAKRGRVARIVVANAEGSSPREVGAAMLVWDDGQSGTIGGGALEFEAAGMAVAQLKEGAARGVRRVALGPAIGQCCGGAVTLLTEIYDAATVAELPAHVFVRNVSGAGEPPLGVRRILNDARNMGHCPAAQLVQGWMVEPMTVSGAPLWVFGAGHVGRAIVQVLAPLPDFAITWVDARADRFAPDVPAGVAPLIAANPADVVRHAPADAHHLILTYSHALDLELCHRLLGHGFASAGLIGSATKWARFRTRLAQLGHPDARISDIRCPIGQPELGKNPQAIAVGVAATLLSLDYSRIVMTGATGRQRF